MLPYNILHVDIRYGQLCINRFSSLSKTILCVCNCIMFHRVIWDFDHALRHSSHLGFIIQSASLGILITKRILNAKIQYNLHIQHLQHLLCGIWHSQFHYLSTLKFIFNRYYKLLSCTKSYNLSLFCIVFIKKIYISIHK